MSIDHFVQFKDDAEIPYAPEFRCEAVICSDLWETLRVFGDLMTSEEAIASMKDMAANAIHLVSRFEDDPGMTDFFIEVTESDSEVTYVPARVTLDYAPQPVVYISAVPTISVGAAKDGAA